MKENITPEEKLLRLIRGKKTPVPTETKSTVSPQPQYAKPLLKTKLPAIFPKYVSFLSPRKIIVILFIVACLYLLFSLLYPWIFFRKIKLPNVTQEKIDLSEMETKIGTKPYEYYLEATRNRSIFASPSSEQATSPLSSINTDLMKDINLVGIILGENPQAVIEDKKTAKTYYVIKGQFIGEFQVEDIQEGKIIINYRGQKFELYL